LGKPPETAGKGGFEMQRTRLRSARETVGERGRQAREVIAERAPEVKEKIAEAAGRGREVIAERAPEVKEKIAEVAERGRETAAELSQRLAEALAREELPQKKRRSSMIGKLFNRFTAGFAAGYVLGARAGRERYEQLKGLVGLGSGAPEFGEGGGGFSPQRFESATDGPAPTRQLPQSIREVMTAAPETVGVGSTLAEAAQKMKEMDAGAMVVVDEKGKVAGILTDRDIAVRAVAEGKDPSVTKVSDVASTGLVTLSPSDTVVEAVKLMREKAVRRLPVVEGGKAVGIVSIGDLAVERDRTSLLADISAAAPSKDQ
jgi:CBS domain-containing protein